MQKLSSIKIYPHLAARWGYVFDLMPGSKHTMSIKLDISIESVAVQTCTSSPVGLS